VLETNHRDMHRCVRERIRQTETERHGGEVHAGAVKKTETKQAETEPEMEK
jgi:hypothetical protein